MSRSVSRRSVLSSVVALAAAPLVPGSVQARPAPQVVGPLSRKGAPIFDGTRFEFTYAYVRWDEFSPRSLLDVPRLDEFCSEGDTPSGVFMTRAEALEAVVKNNEALLEQSHGVLWAVLVEIGRPYEGDGFVAMTCSPEPGAVGEATQDVGYPIRLATVTREEIERYALVDAE